MPHEQTRAERIALRDKRLREQLLDADRLAAPVMAHTDFLVQAADSGANRQQMQAINEAFADYLANPDKLSAADGEKMARRLGEIMEEVETSNSASTKK